jgi:hypothetical protein
VSLPNPGVAKVVPPPPDHAGWLSICLGERAAPLAGPQDRLIDLLFWRVGGIASATGRTPQRTACTGPVGPDVSGLRSDTDHRLRTPRDPGCGLGWAAEPTHHYIYRSGHAGGPDSCGPGLSGWPRELRISEQLRMESRRVTSNVSLQGRADPRTQVSVIPDPQMLLLFKRLQRRLLKRGERLCRYFHCPSIVCRVCRHRFLWNQIDIKAVQ